MDQATASASVSTASSMLRGKRSARISLTGRRWL
jgi:hypothetical protein